MFLDQKRTMSGFIFFAKLFSVVHLLWKSQGVVCFWLWRQKRGVLKGKRDAGVNGLGGDQ